MRYGKRNVFIAGRGNKAHIHYDGDQRQVLLYQVFGRKEVILLPPASGAPFKPLDHSGERAVCYASLWISCTPPSKSSPLRDSPISSAFALDVA